MNMAILRTLSLLCIMALWGCSASQPPPSLAERYAQLAGDTNFSQYAMQNVASEAYQQGDLILMAKAQWKLCQRAVARGSNDQACERLLDIAIIQKDGLNQARAHLAQYFFSGNQADYERAMAVLPAGQDYYNSLLAPSLTGCLNETEESGWLAMLCYQSGKAANNEQALSKALVLFERYNARHNMADSYYLLAQIYQAQGDVTRAADHASKAALLLSQLGESTKSRLVRNWRRKLTHAQ